MSSFSLCTIKSQEEVEGKEISINKENKSGR
jgi:hypothetical protein